MYTQRRRVNMGTYTRYEFLIECLHCHAPKWAVRTEAKFCSQRCGNFYFYESGVFDRATQAQAANKALRGTKVIGRKKRILTPEQVAAISAAISAGKVGKAVPKLQGANHPNWRGGASVNKDAWHSKEYQAWRKAVFRRDGYRCVSCGDARGGNLQADHIKPRILYPELTFDVANGRTLCKPCHRQTPTWGHNAKLLLWLRNMLAVALL